jgi:hypothetical protein
MLKLKPSEGLDRPKAPKSPSASISWLREPFLAQVKAIYGIEKLKDRKTTVGKYRKSQDLHQP